MSVMKPVTKLCLLFTITALVYSCESSNKNFDGMGVFESDEVLVSSEVGGKIIRFDIKEGDKVVENMPIGQIDTIQLNLTKSQLLKKIESAIAKKIDINSQTAPTKQQIKTAEREKIRTEQLLKADAATTKSLDDINASLALLKRQLDAQISTMSLANKSVDDEIESMNFQIEMVNDNINKSVISSPINGVVLSKYSYRGEIAAPGKPLFKVADIDTLRLKVYITAPQLSMVKLGDKVNVSVDFGNKYRHYDGVVTLISDTAEFTPKTIMTKDERENLVYAIKVDVENDGYIKIGSYGEISFKNPIPSGE